MPRTSALSRRAFLRSGLGCSLVACGLAPELACSWRSLRPRPLPSSSIFSADDEAWLDELQRAGFLFFWENAHPETGLVKDRSLADGPDDRPVASIAATGFGLSALCLAHARGYASAQAIERRVLASLRFLRHELPHHHGFYFHFVHHASGARQWQCELSSIDTAILLCGVLCCAAYFNNRAIRRLAREIYERVDWPWMLNGADTFSHGWKPESGFLPHRWNQYSELMMIYLLALGSETHPVPAFTWHAWERPWFQFQDFRYINPHASLFIHQYSHAWFDFRQRRDAYANYFANSVTATQAHRAFCLSIRDDFPSYEENLWGVTASDSPQGYRAWGGPPAHGNIDGTVVPCAAGGSLAFLPQLCLAALQTMRARFRSRVWKRYGFIDAFHPTRPWDNPDVIGIDVGITFMMAENARTGFFWDRFMSLACARRGMRRAGLWRDS